MPVRESKENSPIILLAMFAAVCVGCDFLMMPLTRVQSAPPSMPEFPVLLAVVGCVLAQGCLLAAWLAWSDQPFWRRFRRHWLVAAGLYLIWAVGLALVRPPEWLGVMTVVGLSVPLVSMATQIPLWIVRQLFGWRLIRVDQENTGPARLSIRHLMYATILVAISLALVRLAPIPNEEESLAIGALWSAVAAIFSTLAMLPGTAFLKMQPFRRGAWFAGMYAAFWVGLLWSIVLVVRVRGLANLPPVSFPIGASCLILSFAVTVIVAARIAHALGYRLVSGRSSRNLNGGR